MITDVNVNEITIDKKPTVGERLCRARQAKNLTIAEVATELRLTKQTIELIENEQWSELHGRAYARGYLSNYVKFLGLPEEEFLTAFNLEYIVVEPSLIGARHQLEISNKKIVWLPSLLFITIAVIGWFAYQQMQDKVTTDVAVDEEATLFPITATNSSITNDETYKENDNIVLNSQQDMNELEERATAEAEPLANGKQIIDNPVIATDQVGGTIESQGLVQESNVSDPISDDTAITSEVAVLDLRFSDDCWVQVKDANDKVLLKKLMTKDDSIILTGRAPLSVMLGRASVSQVRFNDELFDPSAFTQKDVARFTLGA